MRYEVVIERTGRVVGSFALVGKQVVGPPAAHQLLANLVATPMGATELQTALDGYTNGYYVIRADPEADQTAAVSHEFCLNPLHPGVCKGTKRGPRKLKVDGTGKPELPKAGKARASDKPKAAPKKAAKPKITDKDLQTMPDDELFELFAELSKQDTIDEPLMRRLIDDMDRRERQEDTPAPPELTPQQRRVDELVAGGRDFLSAYAEVHGQDEDELARQEGRTAVDRRPGETTAKAVRRSYDEFTHMRYLQAEKATRGHMLNKAGQAAGVDPLSLFTGPVARARRYASEELMRWWQRNERMNLTQFRAQVIGSGKDKAAAAKTRQLSNAKDFI